MDIHAARTESGVVVRAVNVNDTAHTVTIELLGCNLTNASTHTLAAADIQAVIPAGCDSTDDDVTASRSPSGSVFPSAAWRNDTAAAGAFCCDQAPCSGGHSSFCESQAICRCL